MKYRNPGVRRLLLLAAVLAVAGGGWLWVTQHGRGVEDTPAPSAGHTVEARAVDAVQTEQEQSQLIAQDVTDEPPPSTASSASAALPMNYLDMPVAELLDLLGERARAGDPVATCRLGHALNECRMHAWSSSMQPWYQPRPPQNNAAALERFIEMEAERQEEISRWARRCGGLERADMREGIAFSAHAALAGHNDSLIQFLAAPETASADFISDPRFAEIYRTQAWPALLRALRAGDARVTIVLMTQLAHPQFSPLDAVVPERYQNPEAALAMLGMLTEGDPSLLRGFHSGEPPSAEAVETAARWVDELFDGRLPDLSGESRIPRSMPPLGSPDTCESDEDWLDDRGS